MTSHGSGNARGGTAAGGPVGSMKAMLGRLSPQGKDNSDPLLNAKAAAAWLRQLPALDVIGRQQQVTEALDAMRKAQRDIDLSRVNAIQFVDAALGADRRQLIKQYVENADGSPKLAERIWQSLWELSQAFMLAYQAALESALRQTPPNARWKPLLPLLFVRLVHFHGTDAKLRVFKYERWIPAKWMELHRIYLRACELACDRTAVVLPAAGADAQAWSVEQEYLYVLLVHQLNTGNLGPAEVDWASSQLRAWSRRLALEQIPKSVEGFFVDLAGRTGLVRRNGNDRGSVLRYLDTTPLADALDRAVTALRGVEMTDQGPVAAINQQRMMVLHKIRPAVSPSLLADLRRDPRTAVAVSARVRIGLSRICQDLGARSEGAETSSTEHIEVFPVAGAPRSKRKALTEDDSLAASLSSWSDPMWEIKDRSVAGLRIAAAGGIGQSLSLGALVAVRQSDSDGWLLGVVRRLNKLSNEEVEAGVNIIAERMVAVSLFAKRKPSESMGYVVDGLDLSTMGERFEGIYLPPPSRPDKPLAIKTVIVPNSEYAEGRNVLLTTTNSVYTVAFRHLVEQRPDWSWATVQIIEKRSREKVSPAAGT